MPKIVITQANINTVLKLILTWEGKLTWGLLCERIARELQVDKVERQSLAAYTAIQKAYSERKEELRTKSHEVQRVSDDVTVEYLKKQVKELQAEVSILKNENKRYKERFILWQYNAYLNGVRVSRLDDVADVLNKPLTAVNRAKGG
ncbi:hypothetical protein [Shewanella sp. GutDb-MelDb]|uniref:hypothetical protein n=1 Tax=Shewanella sp. GutDb-MelDb TaxID=2058316 RepID=UPI000C7ACFF6|nr:hypothetical protein [Shewanella sp. GutDb-MelDb]PKG55232.1 hypothetical protein CXF82_20605 [Shewanella sp. GutDb-MelDb]